VQDSSQSRKVMKSQRAGNLGVKGEELQVDTLPQKNFGRTAAVKAGRGCLGVGHLIRICRGSTKSSLGLVGCLGRGGEGLGCRGLTNPKEKNE